MKQVPQAFRDHLEGEVTTLCRCWIIETVAGERLGFTDHDQDVSLDGIVCQKHAGVESGSIEERTGLDVNSSDISGALQSEAISAAGIDAGNYDRARVTTCLVNWSHPEEYFVDRVSLVGEIVRRDGHYTMELQGLAAELDQTTGRHFANRCQADLGDTECGVSLVGEPMVASGTVLEVLSGVVLSVAGLESHAAGWFGGGRLVWQTGESAGRAIEVAEHVHQGSKTFLHLWQPMPEVIQPGDGFMLTAGCDKCFSTCKTKFSNHLNFRGFPHVPGSDKALAVASGMQHFDGEPMVP